MYVAVTATLPMVVEESTFDFRNATAAFEAATPVGLAELKWRKTQARMGSWPLPKSELGESITRNIDHVSVKTGANSPSSKRLPPILYGRSAHRVPRPLI